MSGGAPAELTREDREELVALGHSYAFAADGRDFEAFAALFTPDGVLISSRNRYQGREAIAEGVSGLRRYDRTFHFVGQSRYWIDGAVVHGETYCIAHHFIETDDEGTRDRVMYIHYRDEYAPRGRLALRAPRTRRGLGGPGGQARRPKLTARSERGLRPTRWPAPRSARSAAGCW